jgi:uncharacterized protein YjbI with pentapeptide repeats
MSGAYLGRADLRGATLRESDLRKVNLGHANLTGATLRESDLTDATLGRADLTEADLGCANLTKATLQESNLSEAVIEQAVFRDSTLERADLTNANLCGAVLCGANLHSIDLSGASLEKADLSDADLRDARLDGTDLRNADFSECDLRESRIRGITVNQGTQGGGQTRAEKAAGGAEDWDAIARAYTDLKSAFSEAGLVGKTRRYHVLERRARGFEARANGSITGYVRFREDTLIPSVSFDGGDIGPYVAYIESLVSRVTTGFGVRPFRLVVCMLSLFGVAALLYEADPGITNSIYYSVVTFTTAPPPGSEPTMSVVRGFELIETFGGTLLIVLLGYVLGNRERF